MKRWAWILLITPCFAQTQGNRPDLIEGYISNGSSPSAGHYHLTLPTTVNSGEVIVACAGGDSGAAPFTLTSTPTETWTTAGVTSSNGANVQLFYTTATSTASYTIDLQFTTPGHSAALSAGHYKNISGTADGSVATATATGTPTNVSTTQTTTTNGDLLISCGAPTAQGGVGDAMLIQAPSNFAAVDGPTGFAYQSFTNTGAKGSQTVTFKNASATIGGTGLAADLALQTVAFPPATIVLTDTAMPSASAGVAYAAQLHGIGGTAALTYACTGLPSNGLSLNTSSGVISGSTPTAGTVSIGCTVTDGTLTSATDNLTITIGSSAFQTPIIRQTKLALNASSTTTLSSPVVCGSVLGVIMHGFNSHGTNNGWVQNDNGSTESIKDDFGNVLHRVQLIGGTNIAPLVAYFSDPITYSGTAKIHVNKTTSGSPLMSAFVEISGVQGIMDDATFDNRIGNATSPFTLSNSYTTTNPNQMLLGVTVSQIDSDSYSLSAPFSLIAQDTVCAVGYDCLVIGNASIATAGSTTETTTITSSNPTNDNAGNLLLALRPALPLAACNTFTGAGEKIRRQIW